MEGRGVGGHEGRRGSRLRLRLRLRARARDRDIKHTACNMILRSVDLYTVQAIGPVIILHIYVYSMM